MSMKNPPTKQEFTLKYSCTGTLKYTYSSIGPHTKGPKAYQLLLNLLYEHLL